MRMPLYHWHVTVLFETTNLKFWGWYTSEQLLRRHCKRKADAYYSDTENVGPQASSLLLRRQCISLGYQCIRVAIGDAWMTQKQMLLISSLAHLLKSNSELLWLSKLFRLHERNQSTLKRCFCLRNPATFKRKCDSAIRPNDCISKTGFMAMEQVRRKCLQPFAELLKYNLPITCSKHGEER